MKKEMWVKGFILGGEVVLNVNIGIGWMIAVLVCFFLFADGVDFKQHKKTDCFLWF